MEHTQAHVDVFVHVKSVKDAFNVKADDDLARVEYIGTSIILPVDKNTKQMKGNFSRQHGSSLGLMVLGARTELWEQAIGSCCVHVCRPRHFSLDTVRRPGGW